MHFQKHGKSSKKPGRNFENLPKMNGHSVL